MSISDVYGVQSAVSESVLCAVGAGTRVQPTAQRARGGAGASVEAPAAAAPAADAAATTDHT